MRVYFRNVACVLVLVILAGCSSGPVLKEKGLAALKHGDYETAVNKLEKACLRMPKDATVFCNLGVAYWRLGKLDEALESLEDASRLRPTDPRPLEFMGWVYIEKKDWARAKKIFTRASERAPQSPRVLTAKAVTEMRAGEVKYAVAYLTEALKFDPDYPPALYNLGVLLKDHTLNVEKAAVYFRRYLEVADNDEHAKVAQEFLNNMAEAPKAEALPDVNVVMAEAKAAIKKEQFDTALVSLKELLKMFPDNPDVMWEIAVLYDKHLEYPEKAKEVYEIFKKQFPDDPRNKAAEKPKPEEKPAVVEKPAPKPVEKPATVVEQPKPKPEPEEKPAVVDKPETVQESAIRLASEAFSRGNALLSSGRFKESISQYEKALKYNPKFTNAALNLGLAYKEIGELEKARHSFEYTISLDPRVVKAHYMLGVIYYSKEMKDVNKGIQHVSAAVEIKPDYAKAHYLLGLLWKSQAKARPDLAKKHFERCIELVHEEDPLGKRAKDHLSKLNL